jgi:PKD repeat protein
VAQFGYAPVGPIAGGTTTFDASRSTDADGDTIVSYLWSFGDGTTTAATASPVISHSFATTGNFKVTLTVVDCRDARGSATVTIPVGKTSVAICRSHRTVAVALPHTQGAVVLSVTIATVGKSTRRIRGASLRRSALHLSFFGYPKRPVTVTVRYRQQGHTKSRKHTYHPCTSGH